MKLYITGSVGSGKSTLAEQISQITGVPCTHLDELIHMPCSSEKWGNIRRSDEEVDSEFNSIITLDHYVIEDNGRERFVDGMKSADKIIILDIPLKVRKYRIVKRWIRQNIGLESCIYKPKLFVLKSMFRWLNHYESGEDGAKSRLKEFESKTIYLTNQNEIERFLSELQESIIC
ncbi:MAG: hypothetical protein K2L19_04095 [Eubacterium sp.]|nr:hypothetical protein [Eubacterium sp.]